MIGISIKNNTKLIFGFPSNQAIPSQLSSGFKLLKMDINNLTNPLNYQIPSTSNSLKNFIYKLLRLILSNYCKLLSKKHDDIVDYQGGFDRELSEFSIKFSKKNKNLISVFYSEDYIKWKYLKNPIARHKVLILLKNSKIKGLLGYKIEDKNIIITDLSTLKTLDIIKLIRYLFALQKGNSINLINIWVPIINKFFLKKIILFFLGFIVQRKFSKKIIYYSKNSLILNNINNFNINKSLLR